MELNKNIFIGTVGYHILSNHSIGPILLPTLKETDWPGQVVVDELNWGPVAVVQQFQALTTPYDRVILLTAIERNQRNIGEITLFRWGGGLPDEKQIQACVGDAATGVISVENLLVIGEYFKIWPKEVFLVDVEPGPEKAGEHLTPEVEEKIPSVLNILKQLTLNEIGRGLDFQYLRGNEIFVQKE